MIKGYEWELLGNYGYGWDVLTTYESLKEAREGERTYRLNELGAIYKVIRVKAGE